MVHMNDLIEKNRFLLKANLKEQSDDVVKALAETDEYLKLRQEMHQLIEQVVVVVFVVEIVVFVIIVIVLLFFSLLEQALQVKH